MSRSDVVILCILKEKYRTSEEWILSLPFVPSARMLPDCHIDVSLEGSSEDKRSGKRESEDTPTEASRWLTVVVDVE